MVPGCKECGEGEENPVGPGQAPGDQHCPPCSVGTLAPVAVLGAVPQTPPFSPHSGLEVLPHPAQWLAGRVGPSAGPPASEGLGQGWGADGVGGDTPKLRWGRGAREPTRVGFVPHVPGRRAAGVVACGPSPTGGTPGCSRARSETTDLVGEASPPGPSRGATGGGPRGVAADRKGQWEWCAVGRGSVADGSLERMGVQGGSHRVKVPDALLGCGAGGALSEGPGRRVQTRAEGASSPEADGGSETGEHVCASSSRAGVSPELRTGRAPSGRETVSCSSGSQRPRRAGRPRSHLLRGPRVPGGPHVTGTTSHRRTLRPVAQAGVEVRTRTPLGALSPPPCEPVQLQGPRRPERGAQEGSTPVSPPPEAPPGPRL